MSDSHVESSFAVQQLTDEEIAWWDAEGRRNLTVNPDINPEDQNPPISHDWVLEAKERQVWFHSSPNIDLEAAASVIQRFIRECRPKECFGFTWAETCSKPMLDSFGGGAFFITADTIEVNPAWVWLNDKVNRFEKSS